jgi:hypothetical protein
VVVALADGSRWTVTGTSCLTALSLDATSAVTGPHGGTATMTVDGRPAAITPGASYSGAIVVTPPVSSGLSRRHRGAAHDRVNSAAY